MRRVAVRAGVALATVNLSLFAVMLAARQPHYDRLQQIDADLRNGSLDFTTADPLYIAGRAFYSPVHFSDVPLLERWYFRVNSLAMHGAIQVAYGIDLPSSHRSWFLAIAFAIFATAGGFLVGYALGWGASACARLPNTRLHPPAAAFTCDVGRCDSATSRPSGPPRVSRGR